jgi:hypothetical protein
MTTFVIGIGIFHSPQSLGDVLQLHAVSPDEQRSTVRTPVPSYCIQLQPPVLLPVRERSKIKKHPCKRHQLCKVGSLQIPASHLCVTCISSRNNCGIVNIVIQKYTNLHLAATWLFTTIIPCSVVPSMSYIQLHLTTRVELWKMPMNYGPCMSHHVVIFPTYTCY